jgi:hypothetical protein
MIMEGKMARQTEIRVYNVRAEKLLNYEHREHMWNWHRWREDCDDRMEVHMHGRNRLTHRHGEAVDFGAGQPLKRLEPFHGKHYQDFDALIADMHGYGYFITDYRKLVGVLHHFDEVLPLIDQGYVIEDFNLQVTIVKRDAGVLHGDIWVVNRDLLKTLKHRQLLSRDIAAKSGAYCRQVYVRGGMTLDTLDEREREILDLRQASVIHGLAKIAERLVRQQEERARRVLQQETQQVEEERPALVHRSISEIAPARRWVPKIEAPAFKKPPRAQPFSPGAVLGHDHEGKPITAKDVAAEGRKTLPKGLPQDLVPDASEDCSDEEWERSMLIEQVKFRRLHGL